MLQIAQHQVPQLTKSVRFVDYVNGLFEQLPTRNSVKKAIKRGELWLNGSPAEQGRWLNPGDTIALFDSQRTLPKAYEMPIEIVWEDDHLAIVHKPAGIAVNGNKFQTLENALVGKLKPSLAIDALPWAKPVHRLDVPTSGLLVMAKAATAHARLGQMFQQRQVQKRYAAVLAGDIAEQGEWHNPIDKHEAHTRWQRTEQCDSLKNEKLSLVSLWPQTGRRHQLRKHCSQAGFPIVGDKEYSPEGKLMGHKGLFLAAVELSFIHPITQEALHFELPIPAKFSSLLQREQRRWNRYNGPEHCLNLDF